MNKLSLPILVKIFTKFLIPLDYCRFEITNRINKKLLMEIVPFHPFINQNEIEINNYCCMKTITPKNLKINLWDRRKIVTVIPMIKYLEILTSQYIIESIIIEVNLESITYLPKSAYILLDKFQKYHNILTIHLEWEIYDGRQFYDISVMMNFVSIYSKIIRNLEITLDQNNSEDSEEDVYYSNFSAQHILKNSSANL